MKRSIVLLINICMIAIGLWFTFCDLSYADGSKGEALVSEFAGGNVTGEGKKIVKETVTPVVYVVRTVAIGIAVIMLSYLGIKYMIAAPSEKANIKQQLFVFLIGTALVFGSAALLKIVKGFAEGI